MGLVLFITLPFLQPTESLDPPIVPINLKPQTLNRLIVELGFRYRIA